MRFSSELTEPERTFTSGVSPLGGCYLCRRRVPTVKMNRLQTFFSKGLGRYGQEPAAPRARGLQLRLFLEQCVRAPQFGSGLFFSRKGKGDPVSRSSVGWKLLQPL
jgi:hypothetical protein